jgi:hypothetical protein
MLITRRSRRGARSERVLSALGMALLLVLVSTQTAASQPRDGGHLDVGAVWVTPAWAGYLVRTGSDSFAEVEGAAFLTGVPSAIADDAPVSAVVRVEGVAAGPGRSPGGSQVYVDGREETASAPDITGVVVANDYVGRLSLKVSFANRTRLQPSDQLVIGFNVDRDEQTGGPMGMDYALSATAAGAQLGVWNSSSWVGSGYVPLPGGATISTSDGSVTLTTTVGRLGALMAPRRPQLRFVLIAIANSDQPVEAWVEDVAGPWRYRVELPTKLVASKIVLTPRPRASGVVTAQLDVTMIRGDYSEPVNAANVAARAIIAGRPLRLLHSGSIRSGLGARWRVPNWAHDQPLRGSLTISLYGTRATRTFRATVK